MRKVKAAVASNNKPFNHQAAEHRTIATIAIAHIAVRHILHDRDGENSKPMAGADVINDRLPISALRAAVPHHPIPQIRILRIE